MRRLIDLRHPFFLPLWRRVAMTALCLIWAVVEIVLGSSPIWPMLFGAIGAFCFYEFFIVFDPANYEERDDS